MLIYSGLLGRRGGLSGRLPEVHSMSTTSILGRIKLHLGTTIVVYIARCVVHQAPSSSAHPPLHL